MQLIDYFFQSADYWPERTFLATAEESATLSYRQAAVSVSELAENLRASGYGQGSAIGVLSPNDPSAILAILGIMRAGASWVPLSVRNSAADLGSLCATTQCDLLIYHPRVGELSSTVAAALNMPSVDLLAMQQLPRFTGPQRALNASAGDEVPIILFGTGGTTGAPKAVLMTDRMIQAMTLAMIGHMPARTAPVVAIAAPITHAAGLTIWPFIARGGTFVIHDGVESAKLLRSIEKDRVTSLFLPPTAIYSLLDCPSLRDHDYSSLEYFIYAAAPMSPDKLTAALEVFGPVMCQTFGQAEAPMIITCLTPPEHAEAWRDPDKRHRLRSVGRPSLVARAEIMAEDGTLLPPEAPGEVVVKGPLVMPGYFGSPQQSADVRRPGGWHGTGDIGYRDRDGYIYLIDRKRDMIISGGFNVWPSEVERVIHAIPGVRDCAVIGVPDEKWGERVTAVVEPTDGSIIDGQLIIDECKARLGSVKSPKTVVVSQLPRSAVGKVLKRELREAYWRGSGRRI